jgi:hypothetical protein
MVSPALPSSRPVRAARFAPRSIGAMGVLLLVGVLVTALGSGAQAVAAVPLGTTDTFVVLAGAGITNTGPSTVGGDLGTFPTTSISGSASMTVIGTNHAGDGVTQVAKNDLVMAFTTAAGVGPSSPVVADLGGQTLTAGVYNSASSLDLTGALTLDAEGDSSAVFVFQAGSTLTTASGSQVSLVNGAQACNVFWQVGSSATLGTGSSFQGSILALTSITVTTGTTVTGGVLARNGAVNLDSNTISRPICAAAPTATPSASATAVPTTTGTATSAPAPSATATGAPSASPNPTGSGGSDRSRAGGGGGEKVQVPRMPRGPVQAGDGSMHAGA